MKYLILFLISFHFNNIYASCFAQDEKSICRYPQGDEWCNNNKKGKNYSYRDRCDFFEDDGPIYSNDASGSGAYEVYVSRLSPYSTDVLDSTNILVSAKLKEHHTDNIGVVKVECEKKHFVKMLQNENKVIDESFLKSYVENNKEIIGSFMCEDSFAIRNNRSIKDRFQSSAPLFREFSVANIYRGKNSQIVLNDFSKKFSMQLNEAVEAGKADFSGKYIATNWRCDFVICGGIIDAISGKVYQLPAKIKGVSHIKSEFKNHLNVEWLYKVDSRLMIFAGDVETHEKIYPDSVLFYEFIDSEFKLLKVLPYGKSLQPEKIKKVLESPIIKEDLSITSTDKIVSIQIEEEKSAGGSMPLLLIASLLGLFTFRFS